VGTAGFAQTLVAVMAKTTTAVCRMPENASWDRDGMKGNIDDGHSIVRR
jgi:hypothetical protein